MGFLNPTFSGKEGEVAAAIVKVEVPKDFKFGDSDESLTILVTSEDGEAKGTYTHCLCLCLLNYLWCLSQCTHTSAMITLPLRY